uniref:DUF2024 family protein n=1 Tax=Roseihalotalea indica TaxID=2867963 RepID=A0AA49GRL5_9BACT|nr:DUF2024 family protein [Tunicatimonas sp. TK19036]
MKTSSAQQKVGVWDTYAHKKDGSVLHFDILAPNDFNDQDKIYEFGKQYVNAKGQPEATINAARCQFCHVEETTAEITEVIAKQGYYILEMDDIPRELPPNPTKKDLVFHLKAHFEQYRFKNFSGVPLEEIQHLLHKEKVNHQ